ncbi:unnamed protein product [Hapterophycus canaliculatus]
MWRLLVCLGLTGAQAWVSPSVGLRGYQNAVKARTGEETAMASASRAGRTNRIRIGMGTEFEDENAKEKLKAMLNRQFGIGDSTRPDEWCKPTDVLQTGTVLLADPKPFTTRSHPKMLEKFGLAQPLPGGDQIPPDRAADLMPVVLLVGIDSGRTIGLMLNRRTGVLMGDLGDDFTSFMIQPLWLGGTQGENGITFIHTYPEVEGAQPISEEEGLYFSGDMASASKVVTDGPGSGFNFRFFAQITVWGPGELESEVKRGLWRPAVASKMALLRVRDRKGPDVAKPMWADLSAKAGGEYLKAMEEFYRR